MIMRRQHIVTLWAVLYSGMLFGGGGGFKKFKLGTGDIEKGDGGGGPPRSGFGEAARFF